MAEDATVVLRAEDQLSVPVLKAVAAMQQLQAALSDVAKAAGNVAPGTKGAGDGLRDLGEAASKSEVPHRAAHQALGLISHELTNMAGVAGVAGGAVRVFDSILLQLLFTGGAISAGFIAVAAAASAISVAVATVTESSKKEKEELDALVKRTSEATMATDGLTRAQKELAAQTAGATQKEIIRLEGQIGDLSAKLKDLRTPIEEVRTGEEGMNVVAGRMTASFKGSNDEIQKTQQELTALKVSLDENKRKLEDATMASVGFGKAAREATQIAASGAIALQNGIGAYVRAQENAARQIETIARREEAVQMDKLMAISGASIMVAKSIGEAMGQAALSMQDAFGAASRAIIGLVVDLAIKMVTAHLTAARIAAMGWAAVGGPFGLAMTLGSVAVIAGLGALAAATLSPMKAAAMAPVTPASSSGGASTAASGGAGGRPVASAQSQVTNNIQVNLPVQAIDLASISDMTMKAFAFRVGKVIQEAAATGQFSLAGA